MQGAGQLLLAPFMIQTFSGRVHVPGSRFQVLCPSTISQDLDFRPGPRSCDYDPNNIYPCNGVWVTSVDQESNSSNSDFSTCLVLTLFIVHEILVYLNSMCECIWTGYVVYTQFFCMRQTSWSWSLSFETMFRVSTIRFSLFPVVAWSKSTLATRGACLHKSIEG